MTADLFALAAILSLPKGPISVLLVAAGLFVFGAVIFIDGLRRMRRDD